MWDRRGGSITRVADTLVISVSQPAEPSPWGDVAPGEDCGHGAELRNHDCPSPMLGAGSSGTDSLNASGTWLSADSDSVTDLGAEDISLRAEDTSLAATAPISALATPASPVLAAAGDDGIQIICRFDYESRRPSPPSSPPPYPPPPPPTESPPVLAALSRDVSEFSSIIEIDGDSFCIRSRLAGREEPEEASSKSSPGGGGEDSRRHGEDSDSDGSEDEDETSVLVAQCRRFYESRLVSRWPALMPDTEDDFTSVREDTVLEEEDEEERPTSVDSGRESGTDSRSAEEDGVPPPLPAQGPPIEKAQTPLEAKMALLRREVSSLMRRDNELFRQLLSIHDSIEALKHGDGSLSAGSSLCSLAGIEEEEEEREEEEEDTISTPSTDLDRQSRLSAETDTFSLVKGDSGSERSFFSEILHVTGMSQWTKSRLAGPASLTPDQMAPPSIRQAAPPPLSPVAEKGPIRRHRKQGSCDSGIVDQEIRSQA